MPVVPPEPPREDCQAAPRPVPARRRSLGPDNALIRAAQLDFRKPGNPLETVENP
jgi:hypothetical protein